ncbi:MAG: hypothetical protein ACREDP_16260, partial [Bradyrhizobium sp.]
SWTGSRGMHSSFRARNRTTRRSCPEPGPSGFDRGDGDTVRNAGFRLAGFNAATVRDRRLKRELQSLVADKGARLEDAAARRGRRAASNSTMVDDAVRNRSTAKTLGGS